MSARFSPCGLRCADPGRTCGRRSGVPDCHGGDDRQRMEEQERDRAPCIQMRRALETENVAEFLHAVFSGIPGSNEAVTIARSARMDGRWRAFFESYSCRVSGAPSLPLSEIDLTRHER